MSLDLTAARATILSAADDTASLISEACQRCEGIDSPLSRHLGVVDGKGRLRGYGDIWPEAAPKYVHRAHFYVDRLAPYLPHVANCGGHLLEIGTGAGYLAYMLRAAYGTRVDGLDLDRPEDLVYREMRRALDVPVTAGRMTGEDFDIPVGCTGVVAFWTMFNRAWGVADHERFLDHCASHLVGERRVCIRFNDTGFRDRPDVQALYARLGRHPLADDRNFVIVDVC
jgi:hypothetical protein